MRARRRKILFEGIVVAIEQMEVKVGKKGWHLFQVVRHPGGAGALPIHDDGTITLVRQARPAVGAALLEIPAGRLRAGEEPATCAMRELREETGLTAAALVPLGVFHPSPGVFDEVIHLFAARGLRPGKARPEGYEEIEALRLPLEEALRMVGDGRITDGKTIAALFRAGAAAPTRRNSAPGGPVGTPRPIRPQARSSSRTQRRGRSTSK